MWNSALQGGFDSGEPGIDDPQSLGMKSKIKLRLKARDDISGKFPGVLLTAPVPINLSATNDFGVRCLMAAPTRISQTLTSQVVLRRLWTPWPFLHVWGQSCC
jgi:hypothetical protein